MRHLPLLFLLTLACGDNGGGDDDVVDTDTCAFERPTGEASGPLQAGIAKARMPAPVGIGTAGYGPDLSASYPTPFASIYPGTRKIHGHPEIKAVALSRGPGAEVVFVRLDAVGVFHQLRTDIVNKVSAELGRDMDHAIVLAATHTPSGPGRVWYLGSSDTSFFDFIADKFMPEFYERFVDAVVDVILAAYADLAPAEATIVEGECLDGHNDRRCEDGDYKNGTLPVLAVRREGQVEAVVTSYAVHGTVYGTSDAYLSQDVHGGIEEAIEDRFDHPVEALSLNSWGADMSPGNPVGVPEVEGASPIDGGHRQIRRVGWSMANSVMAALEDATWTNELPIDLETHRIQIDRETIGYTPEEFPYEYGGVYCQSREQNKLDDACAEPFQSFDDLLDACLPFNESFPAPSNTVTTVGRLGDFGFVSWPGEPGTKMVEALLARIGEAHDLEKFFFVGYGQDYLGYALLEEEWWYGGYEASGALWGPRQGQHQSDRIVEAYASFAAGTCPVGEPGPLEPFPYTLEDGYTSETALEVGTVVADVPEAVLHDGVVTFTVYGRDPWDGAPLAWIEDETGNALLRPNGMRVDSDDYNFDVELAVEPSYVSAPPPASRRFAWTFTVPVTQPVEGGLAIPDGRWRLKVSIPNPGGDPTVVTSGLFEVTVPL